MDDRISGPGFLAAPGVEDWRAVWGGGWAMARFRTPTFVSAVALAGAIGDLMAEAGHRGDIDLRDDGVTVRLFSGEWEGLSQADAALARAISITARDRGADPAPALVQHVQLSIAAADVDRVRPFWAAVLGYSEVGDSDVLDPQRRGPTLSFQTMTPPRTGRDRMHVDVYVTGSGRGAHQGGDRGWRPRRLRQRPALVDPRRSRGERGRPGHLDGRLNVPRPAGGITVCRTIF